MTLSYGSPSHSTIELELKLSLRLSSCAPIANVRRHSCPSPYVIIRLYASVCKHTTTRTFSSELGVCSGRKSKWVYHIHVLYIYIYVYHMYHIYITNILTNLQAFCRSDFSCWCTQHLHTIPLHASEESVKGCNSANRQGTSVPRSTALQRHCPPQKRTRIHLTPGLTMGWTRPGRSSKLSTVQVEQIQSKVRHATPKNALGDYTPGPLPSQTRTNS